MLEPCVNAGTRLRRISEEGMNKENSSENNRTVGYTCSCGEGEKTGVKRPGGKVPVPVASAGLESTVSEVS